MVAFAMVEMLKNSKDKRLVFYYQGRRYEGNILACDDTFLEFYDVIGSYRKWFKIELIESLEVRE